MDLTRNKPNLQPSYFPRNNGINADAFTLNYSRSASKENRPQRTARSEVSLSKKTLLQQIMPLLQLLRFLGVLPLQFSSSGAARFQLVSWTMLYSLIAYCVVLAVTTFTYIKWFTLYFVNVSEMYHTILGLLAVCLMSGIVVIPLTHWLQARHVATLLTQWVNFQEMYTQGTGKSLEYGVQRGRLMALLVAITGLLIIQQAVSELFYYECHLEPWNYRDIAVYSLVLQVRNMVVVLWAVLCRSTKMAARTMLRHFKQEMDATTRPADTICNYMGLWLEISRLAIYIGTAFCNAYIHMMVYLVATLTIYVYYCIFMMIEEENTGHALWLFSETCIAVVLLFVICDVANGVYQQVGVSFHQYLLSLRVNSRYLSVHSEVDTFLRMLDAEPPVITLNGYVTINRALLTSVGAKLITYLVVLVQFHLSS